MNNETKLLLMDAINFLSGVLMGLGILAILKSL